MITIKTWSQNSGWAETTGTTSATATQKNPKKKYLVLYVDYTKGDETEAKILCRMKNADITDDIKFDDSFIDTANKSQLNELILEDTCKRRLAVRLFDSENIIEIYTELVGASASPGTLNIWAKPAN